MPTIVSAWAWAIRAGCVTGPIAPPMMNGEITLPWLARAYALSAPVITSSKTSGELTLMFPWITQSRSRRSAPKATRAMATESSARSAEVTPPMNGLVDQRRCAYTMSRCRLLTGTSTGSQTVPPEWWSHGDAYVSFTKF